MQEYDELLLVKFACANDNEAVGYYIYGTDTIDKLKSAITGRNLVVGLDQATNKTGCCIMDFDTREVLVVIDLINRGFPSKVLYFESIYSFFTNHIEGENIVHFIYEIPVEHSNNQYIKQALTAMRYFVKDFSKRMTSLSKTNMVEINSNTWKSHFLADNRYKGRRKNRGDVKLSAQEEAGIRCPSLKDYFFLDTEPPDSCDAVGIAFGALEEMYSKSDPSMRRPNRTMQKTNAKVRQEIDALTQDELVAMLQTRFSVFLPDRFELLEFNPDMPVEENCKRYACSCLKLGIIPITDPKVCQELKWETGKELAAGQSYYALCWRE